MDGIPRLLKPGVYYLYYGGRKVERSWKERRGQPPRELPIYIFEGWQTQGFMTFRDGPVFTSLIFSLSKLDRNERLGFRAQQELAMLEGILRKFDNGIYYCPKTCLLNLAEGKFENPFLGIVAVYSYFKGKGSGQDRFFNLVIRNLGSLLGQEIPDVIALKALVADRFQRPFRMATGVDAPAMFAPGFSLLLRQQVDFSNPNVQPNSIAERCIEKLFHDMIWTSYKPLGKPKAFYHSQTTQNRAIDVNNEFSETVKTFKKLESATGIMTEATQRAPKKPSILNSWVANSLIYALKNTAENMPVDIEQLAVGLQVTPNILLDTASKILRERSKIAAYLARNEQPILSETFTKDNIEKVSQLTLNYFPPLSK